MMTTPIIFSRLKVKSGDLTTVKGNVRIYARSFIISLGRDDSNLILHLKFRYLCHAGIETRVVEMNSRANGKWGEKVRMTAFPFRQGEDARITIQFNAKIVIVLLQEQKFYTFPNRLGLESAAFLSVEGDLRFKALEFY